MENQINKLITPSLLPPTSEAKNGWPWTTQGEFMPPKMENDLDWPLISVTIPSLNQGAYLEEAIRSVLLQRYPRLELFVMDGGSTDDSMEVLKRYSPWITAWRSEPDRGQSHAINKGWKLSTGDLIAYLPSDDIYQPNTFMKAAQGWSYQSDVVLITGGIDIIDANSNVLKTRRSRISPAPPLDLSTLDITNWYIAQQSSFFVKSYLDKVGCWLREDLHYVMDRELMYRLCLEGRIIILDEVLAGDRVHSKAKRQKDTIRMYKEDELALSYCTFGDKKDKRKRKRVARSRLAQGYWSASTITKKPVKKWMFIIISLVNHPYYIRRFSLVKKMLPFGRRMRDFTKKTMRISQ